MVTAPVAPPGSSQHCSFPPPTPMPSPAHQGFPPSTTPSSSSMLGRNSQFQHRPKPSMLAQMSQPCPVLSLFHVLWKYPACLLMEVTRSFSLQVQGHTALCCAQPGREGDGSWWELAQSCSCPRHRAQGQPPPASGQGKGKQRKSRDDRTDMQAT